VTLSPGDRAPDFALPSTAGEISLSTMLDGGSRVVLAFYVEDGTPSCSSEISMLADATEMLREFGAAVVAVSADSLESHRTFAERVGGVPFPLASDADLSVARAYDVVDPGDPRRSIRAVFIIERDGTLLRSIVPFQPSHLGDVEAIFVTLGAEV
jgi:peroxiredoxin Q/BCP